MIITAYISTEDMSIKLQILGVQTKVTFYQNISNYYEMNYRRKSNTFQFEEGPFSVKDGE